MSPDDRPIDDLVAAIAEGQPIDWARLLAAGGDDDRRRLVAQLKVLSDIARATDPPPPPPPSPLFRWGHVEVLEELGHGAFGHVYRARDARLDREIALKLFDRTCEAEGQLVGEAQRLARIDHPHVVAVHGADTIDGRTGLLMELVRGRTLHDVLRAQGPFSPGETALVGLDLCRALAAVHGARLVHRDIKVTNVMRETGGRIVLMDFGAGFQRDDDDRGDVATGTPLYMAPELFEGAEASVSTDLYALGVVLFHLVTGGYPVSGASLAELREHHARNARTLLREARPDVPASLAQVVDRALSLDPSARFRGAADMERALAATLDLEHAPSMDHPTPWWRRWTHGPLRASLAMLALVVTLAAAPFVANRFERSTVAGNAGVGLAPIETVAFSLEAPDASGFADGHGLLAVSPDGHRIAFATASSQRSSNVPAHLWMRRMEALVAEPLAGTETGYQPFWSPDNRFVGFTAANMMLKRVDVTGGSVITLADWGLGGTWNAAGVVLFNGRDGRLYRVSENGGPPAPVTTLDPARGETHHLWPSFLPDGRRFLFLAYSSPSESVLYVGSLDSPALMRIAAIASRADYAAGSLFYARQGTLVAQRFDLETAQLLGEAQPIATSVRWSAVGRAAFSVSATGVVVYATEAAAVNSLTWFDSTGKRLASIGEPGTYSYPTPSPDGTRLAVNRQTPDGGWDVWEIDSVRNVSTRFTFNNQSAWWPIVWSPDARHLVFAAHGKGRTSFDLYRRSRSGESADEKLFESADDKQPSGFSPDGRLLLFNRELDKGHGMDIWALPLTGARTPYAVLETAFDEESGVFSPDGRWIAYASNESGAFQVYVQPFPATGVKVQISSAGGSWPRWSSDGKIFYSTADRVWSVDMTVRGGSLRAGVPKALFAQTFLGNRFGSFGVDPIGSRFLLVVPQHTEPSSLKVLVNPLGVSKERQ